jgi:hypothetical protein
MDPFLKRSFLYFASLLFEYFLFLCSAALVLSSLSAGSKERTFSDKPNWLHPIQCQVLRNMPGRFIAAPGKDKEPSVVCGTV